MGNFILPLLLALLCIPTYAQQQLPVQWSTYLGGSGDDQMRDLCVDKDDNVYVCGVFTSPDFPAARGVPTSFDTNRANGGGYLASFSPTGELRWLQFFGCVRPYEIAVSDAGTLVMVGASAIECGGNIDATVSVFRTNGERFARDQFFSGSAEDIATSVDIVGNTIYVGGITQSVDFPTFRGLQPNYLGDGPGIADKGDGFVAKLNLVQSAGGWQLVPDVVTFFGGRFLDEVLVVRARNTLGHVFVGGRTRSDNLAGNGVLQPIRLGTPQDDDGFVTRLDSTTLECQWYTYCGGTGNEVVYGLQPYRSNQPGIGGEPFTIRACGVFSGQNLPLPGGSGYAIFKGGTALGGDGFLLQIRDGEMIQAETWYVGTTADDVLCSFTRGNTNTGPLMFSNGFSFCQNSTFNAYRLNPYPGSSPTGLSSFCGNKDELTLDAEQFRFGFGGIDEGPNSSYICGSTTSSIIPGTDAAGTVFQRTKVGTRRNGFLVKIGCGASTTKIIASNSVLCAAGDSVTLTLQPTPTNVVWADGNVAATRVIRVAGTYKVKYTTGACEFADSIVIKSGILPSVQFTPTDTVSICDTSGVLLTLSGQNIERVFWSTGELSADTILKVRSIRVRTPGRYYAVVFSPDGCSVTTDTVTVVNAGSGAGNRLQLEIGNRDGVRVGDTLRLLLRWNVPPGSALESLPRDWSARLRFDRYLFFPVRPLSRGVADDSLRTIVVSGRRKLSSDTLGIVLLHVALGDTDTTGITVDSLVFDPCGDAQAERTIGVRIAGICQAGDSKRFVSTQQARLRVVVASNPVGTDGAIATAEGEGVLEASGRIVNVMGQEIPAAVVARTSESAEWTIPSWLPTGRYVFVVQTPVGISSTIFEVVR